MEDTVTPARRSRRWTRVEPFAANDDRTAEPIHPDRVVGGAHHLVVYQARLVRCSCGATILATDPAALRAPVGVFDHDALELHTSWCEELELADFVAQSNSTNGHRA